ncbi:hypothetical protein ACE38V_22200 [Cytobacillus sp. Hz8]|uniref:hypothetical protein n=1 Tax=Cytobacillus sp. Hz8 TaxID=3347168 RepID=UPI0035DDC1E3
MIDRMAFNNHRPAFAGRTAIIVTTSGIGSSNHALKTMNIALHVWGFHMAGKEKFRTGDWMEVEGMKRRYSPRIKNIVEKLFYAIVNQTAKNPSFYKNIGKRQRESRAH